MYTLALRTCFAPWVAIKLAALFKHSLTFFNHDSFIPVITEMCKNVAASMHEQESLELSFLGPHSWNLALPCRSGLGVRRKAKAKRRRHMSPRQGLWSCAPAHPLARLMARPADLLPCIKHSPKGQYPAHRQGGHRSLSCSRLSQWFHQVFSSSSLTPFCHVLWGNELLQLFPLRK